MARVQRYEGDRQLSTAAPGTPIDPGSVSRTQQAVGQIGQQVASVADQFAKLRDLNETMQAKLEANKQLREIKERAILDQDPYSTDKYLKEIDGIKQSASKKITGANARTAFEMQLSQDADTTAWDIRSEHRKKAVDVAKGNVVNFLADAEKDYAAAVSPQQKQLIRQSVVKTIDDHIQAGVLTHEDGEKNKIKILKDLTVSEIKGDISEDPAGTLSRIDSGWYEQGGDTLDPDVKRDLRELAEKAKARLDQDAEKAIKTEQNKYEAQRAVQLTNGQVSLQELQDDLLNNKITREFYQASEKRYEPQDTKISEIDKGQAYVDLLTRTTGLGDDPKPEDVMKIRTDVLSAANSGLITPTQFKDLYEDLESPADRGLLGSAINLVKSSFGALPPFSLIAALHKKLRGGDVTAEQARTITQDLVEKYRTQQDPSRLLMKGDAAGTASAATGVKLTTTLPAPDYSNLQVGDVIQNGSGKTARVVAIVNGKPMVEPVELPKNEEKPSGGTGD